MKARNTLNSLKVDEKRLLAYAAAAGALLAAAGPADASVVYGAVVNGTVDVGTPVTVAMGAGTAFSFNLTNTNNHLYGNVKGIGSGASIRKYNGATNPKALKFDRSAYLANGKYQYATHAKLFGNVGTLYPYQFAPSNGGYIGVKFTSAGNHHGWINIDTIASDYSSYHVNDWAYESTPDAAIKVGDTGAVTVPEPGSSALALLAMAVGGVALFRKRKQDEQGE